MALLTNGAFLFDPGDRGYTWLDDAGFFKGNLGDGVSQVLVLFHTDVGDY